VATPVVEGWFTTGSDGEQPSLLGGRCTTCGTVTFPAPTAGAAWCPDPACPGAEFEQVPLSRRGTVWSYTDESGERLVWRWKSVTELGEEADQ
jgi:uncharacterized OB-fold protein